MARCSVKDADFKKKIGDIVVCIAKSVGKVCVIASLFFSFVVLFSLSRYLGFACNRFWFLVFLIASFTIGMRFYHDAQS
jgi:hypothetical protein